MAFHVGQRVVCISSWPDDCLGYGDETGPKAGFVYTIREIGFIHPAFSESVCVLLAEIKNPTRKYVSGIYEPSFGIERFRPLTDRKSEFFFTMGADSESEKWDNRKRVKVRS